VPLGDAARPSTTGRGGEIPRSSPCRQLDLPARKKVIEVVDRLDTLATLEPLIKLLRRAS